MKGMFLGNLALTYIADRDYECAEAMLTEALGAHRDVGNARSEAAVLTYLGLCRLDSFRLEEAEEAYRTAARLHARLGNRLFEAECNLYLGIAMVFGDRLDEAESFLQRAKTMSGDLGSSSMGLLSRAWLAAVECVREDLAAAGSLWAEASAFTKEVRDPGTLGGARVLRDLYEALHEEPSASPARRRDWREELEADTKTLAEKHHEVRLALHMVDLYFRP